MNVVMAKTGRKYGLRVLVFLGLVVLVVVAPYLPKPPDPEHLTTLLGVGVALILGDTIRPMGTVTSRLPAAATALMDAVAARASAAQAAVVAPPAAAPPRASPPGVADAYPPRPTVPARPAPSRFDGASEAELVEALRRARARRAEGEGEAG